MKSSMLFAGIGLSALLLAACENQAQEKVEQKADQTMEVQDKSMGTDKQQMKNGSDNMNKMNDMSGSGKSNTDSKMMETKPAQ